MTARFVADSPLEGGGFELPVPRGRPALNNTPRPNECRYFRRSDRHSGVRTWPIRNWEPMVRIHLPPPASQVRTCLSPEFAFLRREAAVFRGGAGRGERRGRQRRAGHGNIGPTSGNISGAPYSSTAPPVMWANSPAGTDVCRSYRSPLLCPAIRSRLLSHASGAPGLRERYSQNRTRAEGRIGHGATGQGGDGG